MRHAKPWVASMLVCAQTCSCHCMLEQLPDMDVLSRLAKLIGCGHAHQGAH